jgi:hypothetical protein
LTYTFLCIIVLFRTEIQSKNTKGAENVVAETKKDAVRIIGNLDLSDYAHRAVWFSHVALRDKEVAMKEYRQFLFLDWINKFFSNDGFMAPTELADAIWQQHILHTHSYQQFSLELIGSYIHRCCPFEKDAPLFIRCVQLTQEVHRQHGADGGFSKFYFGVCAGRSF